MRKPHLTYVGAVSAHRTKPRKTLYIISLRPGFQLSFSNMKLAKAALARYSHFLTEQIHELNYLLIDFYTMYRHQWFYFSANRLTDSWEAKIQVQFAAVENALNKVAHYGRGPNGCTIAYNGVYQAASNLAVGIKCLELMCRKRSDHAGAARCRVMAGRAAHIIRLIENYAAD